MNIVDNQIQIYKSKEDASVNFVIRGNYPGYQEARYVRRRPDYMIAYVSTQTGCAMGCRFCHLTASRQTQYLDLSIDDIVKQAQIVLDYYASNEPKAEIGHCNFMARGEFFDNVNTLNNGAELVTKLHDLLIKYNLKPKILISTIMPKRKLENKSLFEIFKESSIWPIIYYSLYSIDPSFRKKWIPNGLDPEIALRKLQEYQLQTNQNVKLHWALIKDENDSNEVIEAIANLIRKIRHEAPFRFDINLVRYNPYSPSYGQEADEEAVRRYTSNLKTTFPDSKIKVVDRVGFDVFVSCGCFLPKSQNSSSAASRSSK